MRRFAVALLLSTAFWQRAAAEEDLVRAILVDRPPRIDGGLDDPAWQKAALVDRFFQRDPKLGDPVSEKREFLICYDRARDIPGHQYLSRVRAEGFQAAGGQSESA